MDVFYRDILKSLEFPAYQFTATFAVIAVIIAAIVWNSNRKHQYWKQRGVPYVKPSPLVGSVIESFRKPLHETDFDNYKQHGKIYGYYEGNLPVLYVAEPDLLRSIMVKDFHIFPNHRHFETGNNTFDSILINLNGETWKRVRTIITPTFTTGKIKKMFSIIKDCTDTLIKNFKTIVEKGEPADLKGMFGAFTMDVIASSAFSTKIDSHSDPNNEFVNHAKKIFSGGSPWKIILFILFPAAFKIFKIKLLPEDTINFFQRITLQIIERRKKTGEIRNDFLQLLMDTAKEVEEEGKLNVTENEKDDIAANYGKETNTQLPKLPLLKKNLSQTELVAQCIFFFSAGYETTAGTLSFAAYELAINQDVQEKLINELDEALSETGGELTYETVQSMKYLDNVLSETLRKYPPAVRIERVASEEYKLGDTGITLEKGMIISVPVFAIHKDPDNYPDPEKFDPDRFTPEERAKRNPYVYLPFGVGPRNCVAMRFALMEIKLCLAHVLTHFRIKRCPETQVPLEFLKGQGLLQTKGIKVQLESRKHILSNC